MLHLIVENSHSTGASAVKAAVAGMKKKFVGLSLSHQNVSVIRQTWCATREDAVLGMFS